MYPHGGSSCKKNSLDILPQFRINRYSSNFQNVFLLAVSVSLVDCLDRLLFVSGSRLNKNKEIQITLPNGQFYLRPFLLYFHFDVVP